MPGHERKRLPAAQERPLPFRGTRRERRNGTTLEIGADLISDDGIRGLLEDWLIPMIVENLIRVRMNGTARPDPPSLTPPDIS
jgi:hypothetical protein